MRGSSAQQHGFALTAEQGLGDGLCLCRGRACARRCDALLCGNGCGHIGQGLGPARSFGQHGLRHGHGPSVGVAESRLRMITLPNDLDFNLHMTNGRFLTIADLSRIDLFLRTGLAKVMVKEKWAPIITEHTMSYKRSLNLFQKFDLVMQLTHWDERCFYMSHQFIVGDRIVAEGSSMGVIRSRDGVVPPETVLVRVRAERGLP